MCLTSGIIPSVTLRLVCHWASLNVRQAKEIKVLDLTLVWMNFYYIHMWFLLMTITLTPRRFFFHIYKLMFIHSNTVKWDLTADDELIYFMEILK